jgi:hypothetical protein
MKKLLAAARSTRPRKTGTSEKNSEGETELAGIARSQQATSRCEIDEQVLGIQPSQVR